MTEPGQRHRAFPPVADARTRVLVLGSLPGAASLAAREYYAHPQNAFWRLIGAAAGRDLAALAYPERLTALRAAGIGLWDVIVTAARQGSLDAAIRDPEAADLRGLVATLPALRAIAFNGGTAARHGRRALGGLDGPVLLELPSSSPAFAAMPFAEKRARWSVLARYLAPD
jgi:TDG/mug DNA glycosylase family protein